MEAHKPGSLVRIWDDLTPMSMSPYHGKLAYVIRLAEERDHIGPGGPAYMVRVVNGDGTMPFVLIHAEWLKPVGASPASINVHCDERKKSS